MRTLHNYASHPTEAVFGVGVDGKNVILPFSKFPHALLAGTTGSGKSVFANNLLISQISHTHPDELKFSIVDPKIVEFARYARLPHMFTDPVTNMGDAYGLMTFFTHLMDNRYDIMKKADNNQNIDDYNQWIDDNPGEAKKLGVSKFCYHMIVIDEFSDMIMQVPDVEAPIIRLAQKARAAGIHLLIMTQRPVASIITGNIKANVPTRICLKVATAMESNVVMDESGGEKLRGQGDGLIKTDSGTVRVQGPFIHKSKVDAIFADLKNNYGESTPFDYRTPLVDAGVMEWVEDYGDDVLWLDRHVKPIKKRRM